MSTVTRRVLTGLVPVISIILLLLVSESALRLFHWITEGIPLFEKTGVNVNNMSPYTADTYLGWRATENYHGVRQAKTAKGTQYSVSLSQNEYGFRMFGDLESIRPKVFVIGDSFTHATDASDDKTYYAFLKDQLNIEIFAHGVGGYGTLQEYMVFDRYIDRIRPHLIVWQYCDNDFINNSLELETASKGNNNGMVRPYWEDGKISYSLPKAWGAAFREVVSTNSRFLAAIFHRIDKLQVVTGGPTVEAEIEALGYQHAGFSKAMQITDELMEKVRIRAGAIPILAFNCNDNQPYNDGFKQISARHNIMFLDHLSPVTKKPESSELDIFAEDGSHLNEYGNHLIGEALAQYLRDNSQLLLGKVAK